MIERVAAWLHYTAICALAEWGLWLVTSPWHSSADSHHGMLAIAPGILLILLSILTLGAGLIARRRLSRSYAFSAAGSIIVFAVVLFLALR
jgi:hypothetical protein